RGRPPRPPDGRRPRRDPHRLGRAGRDRVGNLHVRLARRLKPYLDPGPKPVFFLENGFLTYRLRRSDEDRSMTPEQALDGFPVIIDVPVWWGDQDAFGHVNNAVYFRW